jgi:aldehyde:ferredoxin oxidoreductase
VELIKLGVLDGRISFEDAERVSGETLNERYIAKIIACNSCAMRCEHIAVVPEGLYKGTTTRVEYEHSGAWT